MCVFHCGKRDRPRRWSWVHPHTESSPEQQLRRPLGAKLFVLFLHKVYVVYIYMNQIVNAFFILNIVYKHHSERSLFKIYIARLHWREEERTHDRLAPHIASASSSQTIGISLQHIIGNIHTYIPCICEPHLRKFSSALGNATTALRRTRAYNILFEYFVCLVGGFGGKNEWNDEKPRLYREKGYIVRRTDWRWPRAGSSNGERHWAREDLKQQTTPKFYSWGDVWTRGECAFLAKCTNNAHVRRRTTMVLDYLYVEGKRTLFIINQYGKGTVILSLINK